MELCAEDNIERLYNIMESKGYDTSLREITNIYPSGYKSSKIETLNNRENTENY
ncbi:MAG: hypothetical protein ACFE91_14110 [Promethearchaeota archaeon]